MDFYVLPRVDEIVVEDRVNKRVYRSTAANFIEHRIQINRGAGPQYVLPLTYWQADGEDKPSATSRPTTSEPTSPQSTASQTGQQRLL